MIPFDTLILLSLDGYWRMGPWRPPSALRGVSVKQLWLYPIVILSSVLSFLHFTLLVGRCIFSFVFSIMFSFFFISFVLGDAFNPNPNNTTSLGGTNKKGVTVCWGVAMSSLLIWLVHCLLNTTWNNLLLETKHELKSKKRNEKLIMTSAQWLFASYCGPSRLSDASAFAAHLWLSVLSSMQS